MLSTGRNHVESRRDASAHAEMLCLQVRRVEFWGLRTPRTFTGTADGYAGTEWARSFAPGLLRTLPGNQRRRADFLARVSPN